jgi:hypothetical protein
MFPRDVFICTIFFLFRAEMPIARKSLCLRSTPRNERDGNLNLELLERLVFGFFEEKRFKFFFHFINNTFDYLFFYFFSLLIIKLIKQIQLFKKIRKYKNK